MKLTENPPVEPTYTLVLTESELVALGALSFRHENVRDGGSPAGFYGRMPASLVEKVHALVDRQDDPKTTTLAGVGW